MIFKKQWKSLDWLSKIFIVCLGVTIFFNFAVCQYSADPCRSIQGKPGSCIPLPSCPLINGWLRERPVIRQNLRMLVRYTCSFNVENPKVCCPNDNLFGVGRGDEFNGPVESIRSHTRPLNTLTKFVFPSSAHNAGDEWDGLFQRETSGSDGIGGTGKVFRLKEHVPLVFPTENDRGSGSHYVPSSLSAQNDCEKSKILKQIAPPKDFRYHPNFRLIPGLQECSNAVKLDSLLGTYGVYPWIALIGMKRWRSLDFDHVCAGAIINNRYVLTSAHCFNSPKPRYVRLGEYDLETLIDEGSEFLPQSRREDYRIEKLTIHPNYDPSTGANDIALIRLNKQLALNTTFIRPICLPFLREFGVENRLDVENLAGRKFWVAGWSRHSWDGYSMGIPTTILRDAIVEHTSHENCRQDYPHLSAFASRKQICVKSGRSSCGNCISDSGGPLQIPLKVPGRVEGFTEPKYFLLGLLSQGPTGKTCSYLRGEECLTLPTSVYTRVSKYLSFILDNIHE